MRVNNILVVLFFLAITFTVFAQQPISSVEIDKITEKSMATFNVPGMAIAVIKDGKVIHEKGYGVRNMHKPEKVDENTVFAIASNTKAFCGFALGMLVDEEKISWDDKVIDYIPEFRMYDAYTTQAITIRDLLCHRTGLGLGAGDLGIFPDGADFTIQDIINNLKHLKPASDFRAKYNYNNQMFIVAGEIVARVSGMSWFDFVEERIMKPLEMNSSASDLNRLKDTVNLYTPHAVIDGKLQVVERYNQPTIGSAGGINATLHDLTKWVTMQLNNGKYGNNLEKNLIRAQTHAETWRPQIYTGGYNIADSPSSGSYNTLFSGYALGFGVSDVKGKFQVSHTGGLPGIVTQITMLPEIGLGIIVLTNQQSSAAFNSVTATIKDAYLGIKGVDRVAEYSARRSKSVEDAQKVIDAVWAQVEAEQKRLQGEKPDFDTYTGEYSDPWFGNVDIFVKDGEMLFVSKRSPKISGVILPYIGNCKVLKFTDRTMEADALINFEFDFKGNVSGFKMGWVSPITDFSYDFHNLNFTAVKKNKNP